jgi:hypothetical protein
MTFLDGHSGLFWNISIKVVLRLAEKTAGTNWEENMMAAVAVMSMSLFAGSALAAGPEIVSGPGHNPA